MKKKNQLSWKSQLAPGQARPGQKLAFLGKNAMKFCREFNEQTKEMESWKIVNVRVIVKEDSYQFFIEGRVTSDLIKKIVGYQGEIKHDLTKPDGTPRKLMDVNFLHKLGWKHSIGLETGIKLVYEDFRRKQNVKRASCSVKGSKRTRRRPICWRKPKVWRETATCARRFAKPISPCSANLAIERLLVWPSTRRIAII